MEGKTAVCRYALNLFARAVESIRTCIFLQLIDNKNKGTITRSTDFGNSPLSDIFRGIWRSRLQREGDTSADTLQPFFTLQLNIEVSVEHTIEHYRVIT